MNKCLRIIMRIGVLSAVSLPAFAGVPAPVAPEPATIGLIGAGVAAVLGIRYYRSRKR